MTKRDLPYSNMALNMLQRGVELLMWQMIIALMPKWQLTHALITILSSV